MPARREGSPEMLCGRRRRWQSAVSRAGVPQCGTVATMSCVRTSQNRRRKQHPVKYRQKNTGRNVKACRNGVAGIQMETHEPGAGKVEKNHGGGGQRKKKSRTLTEAAYPARCQKLGDVFQRLDAGLHAAPLVVGDRCPADVQDLRHLFL